MHYYWSLRQNEQINAEMNTINLGQMLKFTPPLNANSC